MLDANGELIEYVGTAVDVTERERLRQLETELAHINRVSMMGELAASLAHDMKQPLTGAAMNANACARWLRRDPPDLKEAREAASRMVVNVMRATDIIDRVRALYTRATPQQELLDPNEVIEDIIDLLHNTASRSSVAIRTDLDPDLPSITADRVQLQQLLMNLMLNGIEAMKDTGSVLGLASKATRDGQVAISVSDSGIGLPPHESERIFEAFFTTKPQGSGIRDERLRDGHMRASHSRCGFIEDKLPRAYRPLDQRFQNSNHIVPSFPGPSAAREPGNQ